MSKLSTRRRAESLDKRSKKNHEIRTVRTGLGLNSRSVGILLVAAAAAALVWTLAVRPAQEDRTSAAGNVERLQSEVSTLNDRLDRIKSGAPDELESLQGRVGVVDTLLPSSFTQIDALDLLLPHANRFGISFRPSTSPDPTSPVAGALPLAVSAQVSGSPSAIVSWLQDLDSLNPMVTVYSSSLSFVPASDDQPTVISGQVVLWLWTSVAPPLNQSGS
jgi:Tfp pilus assembly protein PilO